ncbi:MAG: 2-oxoglutarate dehydrogenase E1 component [Opitutaceae bacterium]|nr:2-oxoglutarate dehydrogenase E1 component [Opitutaceae bacterium]
MNIGVHNLDYVEGLYADFLRDPALVSAEWRQIFQGGMTEAPPESGNGAESAPVEKSRLDPLAANLHERLNELVRNYRMRGHKIAAIDPLGVPRPVPPELAPEYYQFTDGELALRTRCETLPYDEPLAVREIVERLRHTYCRSIGAQFMHIDDVAVRRWLQLRMEASQNRIELSRTVQRRIFTRLTDAVSFEEFLRKKFAGAKTFSLEGSETLIPLLDLALEQAGAQGVREVIFGMAHRGRLNVLTNIIGKNPREIFRIFADDQPELWLGRGDVKYHLGHSGEWRTGAGEKLHLSLCFNPSHLEFANTVVLGRARARQDRRDDQERRAVLGVLIHGDAAFAGEGIVQETLNFSRLPGYATGGTLHIIINNQIGFTTGPEHGRSTDYATDVARMLQVPIFHVNGEDAEAVAQVVRLALEFRQEFQRDVFIDLYGYRRWGHNEIDEPGFTQPVLYRAIAERPNVRDAYLAHLLEHDGLTRADADAITEARTAELERALEGARSDTSASDEQPSPLWRPYTGGPEPEDEGTVARAEAKQLAEWLRRAATVPAAFHLHPKLERLLAARAEMADGKKPLDWGAAEALALASLAANGVRIRLTGQDTGRGTFSHRHAVLHDHDDGCPFVPLQHIQKGQAPVEIVNSPLNEAGALGFEYGYSLDCPDGLVLWEAQFGDFVNAAQVIIDQFVTSGEDKWRRLSGLVLLLPHGFEGMGPEHSSARVERFLQLAAEDNIQVAQPTTPAQLFHLLRRQALRPWRKPLVVFTPKSLLRHPECVSPIADCATGGFQRVLVDDTPAAGIKRVLLCTGKIFYDLAAYRAEQQRTDTAIIRLEQLYPLGAEVLERALQPYADGTPVLWVQEEPANMGAWRHLHDRFGRTLCGRLPFALLSRPESASPATGSANAHKLEQARLVARAFGDPEPGVESIVKKNPPPEKAAKITREKQNKP